MLLSERQLWAGGCRLLAGVDEVGRGPLAGPVVAAAVMLDPDAAETLFAGSLAGLTDSKQLSPAQREHYATLLNAAEGVMIGVGFADHTEIDDINILRATHLAMARALASLNTRPEHALIDGRPVTGLPCNATAIVGGDGKSLSIAAASVVAKVLRDRLMSEEDRRYPQYGFAQHKGYGTAAHIQALLEHGPCLIHRRSFRPVREAEDLHRRRGDRWAAGEDVAEDS
ncbi:MAG: ribonuclease HII [Verrucomicrobia bacterium]|nr:ribonuclease HII [Verrucomicrobiota bacterium]